MHFPKFWHRAEVGKLLAWGWSDTSEDEAAKRAVERVRLISDWLRTDRDDFIGKIGDYYPSGPMREEVLREFRNASGEVTGVVSRNNSGCRVLNTARMLFVDIDEPRAPRTITKALGFIGRWFGGKKQKTPDPSFDEKILSLAKAWPNNNPGSAWRVYRTKAGVRMIATHTPISQDDPMVGRIFSIFEADPLYVNLCYRQQSFRARLTPKPRRCGMKDLRVRWPWRGEDEAEFHSWEERYLDAAKDYATCKLLGQFGAEGIHPDLRELIEYHDRATRVDTNLPLA